MSTTVHILVPGEESVSERIGLDAPAAEAAEIVFVEVFSDTDKAHVDAEGVRWCEIDGDSCRRRAAEAAKQAEPDPRWTRAEWTQSILDNYTEVAQALYDTERRTGKTPWCQSRTERSMSRTGSSASSSGRHDRMIGSRSSRPLP